MVAANNGVPLFVSYGPDGPEQFSPEHFDEVLVMPANLVWDWTQDLDGTKKKVIDLPLNQDNIYSNPEIRDRISQEQDEP